MASKLTLRMDEELISKAKIHAARTGTSVSRMVARYFALLDGDDAEEMLKTAPVTRRLFGLLRESGLDRDDYRAYLEEKHR